MKRHQSLIRLSQDHHSALILAKLLQVNAPNYKGLPDTVDGKVTYALEKFNFELLPHFSAEEIAFDHAKGIHPDIDGLLLRMSDEHNQLKNLFEQLKASSTTENHLDSIGILLEQHVRMEERQLFQLIQEKCNEATLLKIELSIQDRKSTE